VVKRADGVAMRKDGKDDGLKRRDKDKEERNGEKKVNKETMARVSKWLKREKRFILKCLRSKS